MTYPEENLQALIVRLFQRLPEAERRDALADLLTETVRGHSDTAEVASCLLNVDLAQSRRAADGEIDPNDYKSEPRTDAQIVEETYREIVEYAHVDDLRDHLVWHLYHLANTEPETCGPLIVKAMFPDYKIKED